MTEKTEREIAEYSELREEVNGVRWYTQNMHYNVHYIVCQGRVFMYCGHPAKVAFNELSQMSPQQQEDAIREYDEMRAQLAGCVEIASRPE